MAIRTVITRGYGNGTFNGTIALVVTAGYAIGAAIVRVFCDPHIKNKADIAYISNVDVTHTANITESQESDKC